MSGVYRLEVTSTAALLGRQAGLKRGEQVGNLVEIIAKKAIRCVTSLVWFVIWGQG